MNQDRNPFSPEVTALRQGAETRLPEEEAARADERSSRKMMDAPRDEQDRCAQLAAAVPGGLFSFRLRPDGSACCPYANPAFLELFGLPAEDLAESAAALWATLHPDDLDRVRASVATSARSLTPWRDEFRWRRPNGEEIWVEGHSRPVREPDGSILWHGFVQDITARKQTERRLFATHERLQALLQALPVGVSFSEDATCQHITGNPMLRAQFEMTPQDNISASAPEATALGRGVRYFSDGQELREAELPLQRAVAENRAIPPLELAVQLPSGRRWVAEILAAPVRDAQDRIIGGLAVILDITERKQAEERYQTLFEHMLDGFALHEMVCDARGRPVDYRFLAVNPAFERLTGLKANAIVGKTVLEILPSTEPYWIETYGRVALTGEPASFENYARDLDQYFQVTAFCPAPRQFACLFVDITARKRAEAEQEHLQTQLVQAQKMESIGRLAGGVAHDFNNLLGVILGYTELALEHANPVQPLYADLLEIQKAAQRSADLTRQLLAFARKQTIAPQVCDLNETVAGMLKLLRRLIGEPIALMWRPGSSLWPVKVDPAQIDQVLANLCVNARDAIAGVGQITIETGNASLDAAVCAQHAGWIPGEYVRLAVSDDGCGMDAETLAHLFEPFFTTKGVGRGTGLGLATLYGVVQQNRGFIHVSSAPGRGTTFTLYWPRHRDKGAPAALAGPAEPASRGHETVLLVEDEPALLHLGATMLEKLGYRVLAADTPGEAIRLAEEHAGAIHLLMTDVVMPEMNGRDLARRLLSLYPNLKRLFMSGYTASVIAPHGVLDDGVHFLQKPFALQELAAKIRAALEPLNHTPKRSLIP